MKRMHPQLACILTLPVLALVVAVARADDFSTVAFDNATVQPAGPRSGDNGKNYFNIEGISNGSFASFGVADFDSSTFGINFTVGTVTAVTITLNQDNASFTANGAINFYITEDTITSIQPDPTNPEVIFDLSDPEGLNGQLQPIHALGSGLFIQGPNGTMDVFSFALDDATAAYVIGVLNSQGTLRLVITPADPTVAATYAGFSDPNNYVGPMVTVSVTSAN
jgi:hypothetical protein